jgi:predicted nucleic acid-binding protein
VDAAYVDSSAIVTVGLGERGWEAVAAQLDRFDPLWSADLMEAEVRSTFAREGLAFPATLLSSIERIHPDRRLEPEIARVFERGYLKGADAWHLAVALSVAEDPGEITFITLDERQREVAAKLGFQT